MFTAFLYFLAGVLTHKVLQFILSITPSFNIFKEVELTCLKVLTNMYVNQQQTIQVLKTVYDSAEDKEEFYKAEKTIKLHHETLINNSLAFMKKNLPYKVPYNTLNEALSYYIQKNKLENKDG